MPTAIVNNRPIAYTETGGDYPAVILGHGFFLDRTMFAAQAAALSTRWRVITWDARGHGGTPDDEPGMVYTYWDHARDVLGLMDHLDLPKAVLGGVSQGGFIALRTALLAPDRVNGLILCDTEATPCHPADKIAYQTLFGALAEHGPVDELTVPLAQQIVGDGPWTAPWRARWREHPLPLGAAASCLLDRDDVSGQLSTIECPAVLLWGELDRALPRDRMDLLAERLPSASDVHVISGAAHSPPLTHPDQVNPILQDFLATLPPVAPR